MWKRCCESYLFCVWLYHCCSDSHSPMDIYKFSYKFSLCSADWLPSRSLPAWWMAVKILDIILMTVKSIPLSFLPVLNFLAHVSRALYGLAHFKQGLVFLNWSTATLQFLCPAHPTGSCGQCLCYVLLFCRPFLGSLQTSNWFGQVALTNELCIQDDF